MYNRFNYFNIYFIITCTRIRLKFVKSLLLLQLPLPSKSRRRPYKFFFFLCDWMFWRHYGSIIALRWRGLFPYLIASFSGFKERKRRKDSQPKISLTKYRYKYFVVTFHYSQEIMSSTLEALKKKREDLKAKLMRRKEITGIGVGGEFTVGQSHMSEIALANPRKKGLV